MQDIVTAAEQLARAAHQGQMYGQQFYTAHLQAVVDVLREFRITDETAIAAAWLHDALEDTDCKQAEIWQATNANVAWFVRSLSNGPGKNRRERKAKVYAALAKCPGAIPVKLADRIANVRQSLLDENAGLLRMYYAEYPAFRAALYPRSGEAWPEMWATLDILHSGIPVLRRNVAGKEKEEGGQ